MGTYGRHVNQLQGPIPQHRLGRYVAAEQLLQWVPVQVPDDAEVDGNGQLPLELCTGATAPKVGQHGIAVFEQPDANMQGYDPVLTRASDMDQIPAGASLQLVHGHEVRVEYRNFPDAVSFDGQRDYPARIIVAGVSIATPTVGLFDLLTPGVGNDTAGYWAKTADEDLAWLRITDINTDLGLVQAQLLF